MAQTFTHDGVVYEDLGDGNVRAIGYAASPAPAAPAMPQGFTIGSPNPVKQQIDQLQVDKLRTGLATAPYDVRKAEADARRAENGNNNAPLENRILVANANKAEADAAKAKRESGGGIQAAQLDALVNQINIVQGLFDKGIGSTNGIAGLKDWLPTSDNRAFDKAAAALEDQATAAFKVPGMGAQSDADAARIAAANKPSRFEFDGATRQQLDQLKQRVDIQRKALGLPAAQWATGRMEAATGSTRQERDPVASGIIDRMVRQGGNLDTLNTTLANLGYAPVEQKSFDAARQHFRQNPTYAGSYGDATRTVENTTRQQIAGSAPGTFAANAFNDVAAGIPGAIFGTDTLEAQRRANPNAALAGSIVGGAIGSGALELGLGAGAARLGGGLASRFLANPLTADALYGGIQGGATDGSATGALAGAGLGAAGGAAGRGLVRGVGAAARGVTDPSVQYLRRLGVPLTAGQSVGNSGFLGRTAKGIEDRLTGVPVIGDIINARRLEGFQGFNRAAFDEGLAPITPQNARPGWATNGVTGEQGIEAAQTRVGDAFSNALDNVQLQADLPFTADMRATLAAGQALPEPMAGNARYTLNTRIGNSFDNTGGLTGRDFQQSIRGLRRDAAAVANQPYGYDFGQVTRQGEAGLEGLLQRQSPGTLPAYNAANRAFRQTEVLRDAVTRARNGTRVGEAGLFAPSQLADAATANARRFGNANGTTNQPFFDLARAGQNVLPSRIADSGTAGRLAIQGGLGLGVLGGGGYAVGGSDTAQGATATGLGLGALLAAGGTRAGQRAITRTLLDRPDYLRALGDQVVQRSRLGGMFGTAAALPLITYD